MKNILPISLSLLLLVSCSKKIHLNQIEILKVELENCKKNDQIYFNAESVKYSNVLFTDIDNVIEIRHNLSDSVSIEIDNGVIDNVAKHIYKITPDKKGIINLSAYKYNNGKKTLFATQNFRVQKLPSPVIKFDGKSKTEISKSSLLKTKSFTSNQAAGFQYNLTYEVLSFRALILRQDKIIGEWNQTGGKITPESRKIMSLVQPDDLLIIKDCFVKRNEIESIPAMIYKIK